MSRFRKPISTKYLKYNSDTHRWEITRGGCIDLLGIDPLDEVETELEWEALKKEISQDIYSLVRKYSTTTSFHIKEYYISCDSFLEEYIQEALYSQFRYAITSGGAFIKSQHGVNFTRSSTITVRNLRGILEYESRVFDILEDSGMLYVGSVHLPIGGFLFIRGVDY